MASETRRQLPLLVGLAVVLMAVTWWQFGGPGPAPTPATSAARGARPLPTTGRGADPGAGPGGARTPAQVLSRGVGLERLDEDRPAPEGSGRDPFRSGAAPAPVSRGGSGAAMPAPPPPQTPMVQGPLPPPGPPPILVKFIGVVSRRDVGTVAVLSDGKNVYYGREGEIVDGRWRIVSIGEESLQIEHADGRGRQTVRLTG